MMKKLSLAICYIFLNVFAFAQSRITGKVIDDSNGQPIAGATVEVENYGSFVTDDKGSFVAPLSAGKHVVKITSIGFRTFTTEAATGSEALAFRLQRFNLFLQPVEIHATRANDKAPFTKTNISKKELEKNNLAQDLPFLLNQTPSVVVNADAGNGIGYTGIRIRGTDATRINMTLNGIPYNDAESQGIFFVNLPDFASSVSSIQVQRGVGTSSNGAGAFGATLNLSTNEFTEKPYAEVNNTFGSYDTWKHSVKLGTGLLNDHFTIDARLSKITSSGFIDRASSDLKSFFISAAYFAPKSSLRLNVFSGKEKTYQAWNGIPESKLFYDKDKLLQHYYNNIGSLYFTTADSINLFTSDPEKYNVFTYQNQTDNYQQDHYQFLFNHSFTTKLSFNSAAYLTRGNGYYEEFKNKARFSSYNLPDFVAGTVSYPKTDLIRQLWLNNDLYGGIFSVQYKGEKNEGSLGGGVNQYNGKHNGYITWAEFGVPSNYNWYHFDAVKKDFNTYAKWQQQVGKNFQALIDLQYRQVNYRINGSRKFPELKINDQFHFFNPKVGLTYSFANVNAYMSYAIAHKEPNRNDYETGTVQGKPKPEKLRDLEVGVGQKSNSFSWNTTLYYMNYKDQLVLVGKVNDVGDAVRINVADSYRAGIELEGSYKPSKWLQLSGNLAFSQNKIRNFYDNLPRYDANFDLVQQDTIFYKQTDMALSPNRVAAASIQFFPCRNAEISLLNKYVSSQFLDNTSSKSKSINGYFTEDLRIGYSIKNLLAKEINLILLVNNIWNKKYQANGYTYSYIYDNNTTTENFYYPMARRNVLVAVNLKF